MNRILHRCGALATEFQAVLLLVAIIVALGLLIPSPPSGDHRVESHPAAVAR